MFDFLLRTNPDALALEFGPISGRDRIQITATLKYRGQGSPMAAQALPSDVLESVGTALNGNDVCRHVFRIIQSLFDRPALKPLMKKAQVVGVMSDALYVNGLATRLHVGEDKYLVNVTAGTMLRGTVALYRLLGQQALQQLGSEFTQEAISRFHVKPFPMPRGLQLRNYGLECAVYGMLAVFCHELAHVLRGHTTFVSLRLGLDALSEADESKGEGAVDVRRLIEVDADEYAGQFLADLLFRDQVQTKGLLEDEGATARFLKVAAGVLALYLGFGKEGGAYYGGPARAYLVLTSLLHRCSEASDAASWLRSQIQDIQQDMVGAGLVTLEDIALLEREKSDLVNLSIPARNAIQHEWLAMRPWTNDPAITV